MRRLNMEQRPDSEIIAVISAALVELFMTEEYGTKLIVKSLRKVGSSVNIWNITSRIEQLRR
jgi:hypothetical protein